MLGCRPRKRAPLHACVSHPGSSTPLAEDPNWSVTEFETTPVMSTYLLAYIVSEFQSVNETAQNGVLVRG